MKIALAWSRWPWVQILAPPEPGCVNLWERSFYNKGILSSPSQIMRIKCDLMCKTNTIDMNYLPFPRLHLFEQTKYTLKMFLVA